MNQGEKIRDRDFMILLRFILLSGLVVTSITGNQICANFRLEVNHELRDIQGEETEKTNIVSSESLQKKVDEYSFSIGGSFDVTLFSINSQNTFRHLTETENFKKGYEYLREKNKREYSPDSRQLFRVQETVLRFYRYTSKGVEEGVGSVKKEEYVDAIPKKECKVMTEEDLYDESLKYIQRTYGNKTGNITKNVYTEENCVGM